MTQSTTGLYQPGIVQPQVLLNLYPVFDRAGNRMQKIRVRYCCGHELEWLSLDMGKGWKPRTKRQIELDELIITCPAGYKYCPKCSADFRDAT